MQKKSRLLILLFILTTLPIIFLAVRSNTTLQIKAQNFNSLETELGVLSGNVSSGNDVNASSGKYVQFLFSLSPTPTTPPATPTIPCTANSCPTPTGPTRTPTPTPTIDPRWTFIGTHPQASVQATYLGKQISALIGFGGKLYTGYGDYNSPDTPTAITYLDPATNTFTTVLTLQSDGIWNYRILNNSLYAPSLDTIADTADYAVGRLDGIWTSVNMGTTTHVFDMATLTGTDLWMVGSRGGGALVWRSTDGGATWQDSLVQFRNTGKSSAWRFYFAGVLNNKLYVQMKDLYGAYETSSRVFDGTSWSNGPNMLPAYGEGWRPIVFAGKLLYRVYQRVGTIISFDGTGYSLVKSPAGAASFWAQDMLIDGNTLYVLTDRELFKTTDLVTWTKIVNAPNSPYSLGLVNNKFYVGTGDSKIYRLD